jgi:hypothetical protein
MSAFVGHLHKKICRTHSGESPPGKPPKGLTSRASFRIAATTSGPTSPPARVAAGLTKPTRVSSNRRPPAQAEIKPFVKILETVLLRYYTRQIDLTEQYILKIRHKVEKVEEKRIKSANER